MSDHIADAGKKVCPECAVAWSCGLETDEYFCGTYSNGDGSFTTGYVCLRNQLVAMTKELKIAKEFQATAVSERYRVWFKLDAVTKECDRQRELMKEAKRELSYFASFSGCGANHPVWGLIKRLGASDE